METDYSAAQQKIADLEAQVSALTEFKNKVDRAEKQKMIDSFSVLSDEEKRDVIENIDTYSVDEIEAKLAVEAPLKLFFLANDAVAKCFADILQDPNSSIKTRFPRLYATGNFNEEQDGDKYYRWLMTGRDIELLYGLNN